MPFLSPSALIQSILAILGKPDVSASDFDTAKHMAKEMRELIPECEGKVAENETVWMDIEDNASCTVRLTKGSTLLVFNPNGYACELWVRANENNTVIVVDPISGLSIDAMLLCREATTNVILLDKNTDTRLTSYGLHKIVPCGVKSE